MRTYLFFSSLFSTDGWVFWLLGPALADGGMEVDDEGETDMMVLTTVRNSDYFTVRLPFGKRLDGNREVGNESQQRKGKEKGQRKDAFWAGLAVKCRWYGPDPAKAGRRDKGARLPKRLSDSERVCGRRRRRQKNQTRTEGMRRNAIHTNLTTTTLNNKLSYPTSHINLHKAIIRILNDLQSMSHSILL